jgi:PEP-CTERM motif.
MKTAPYTTPSSYVTLPHVSRVLLAAAPLLAFCAIGANSALHAQTQVAILAERFDAHARLLSSGNSTTAWYYSGGVSEITDSANGSLTLNTADGARTLVAHFSPVELALGESLTVSFSFSGTVGSDTSNRSFRFGVFNSNGAELITEDNFGANFTGYTGYMFALNTTTSASQDGRITYKSSGSSLLSTSQATSFGANAPATSFVNNALYTAAFTITRISATDVSITLGIVGEGLSDYNRTWTTSTHYQTAFNTFGIGTGTKNVFDVLTLHSVDIIHTTTIPEPGSFAALLGVGAGVVAVGGRRR